MSGRVAPIAFNSGVQNHYGNQKSTMGQSVHISPSSHISVEQSFGLSIPTAADDPCSCTPNVKHTRLMVQADLRRRHTSFGSTPCRFEWKSCALGAEFLGSFFLFLFLAMPVAYGCDLVQASGGDPAVRVLALLVVSLAAGLGYFAIASSVASVSGGLLSPHVTWLMCCSGHLHWIAAILYTVVQFLGNLLGGLIVWWLFSSGPCWYGLPQVPMGVSVSHAFAAEVTGTVILFTVILFARDNAINPSLSGGAALTLCTLLFGQFSGASFNFFRYLGSAIVSGHFAHAWLYFVGPLFGGFIAWCLYHAVQILSHLGTSGCLRPCHEPQAKSCV